MKKQNKGVMTNMEDDSKSKFYTTTWFMWVTLIFFAPVGIFVMWKYNRFKKSPRIVISIIFALFFIIVVASINSEPTNPNVAKSVGTSKVVPVKVAKTAEEIKAESEAKVKADADAKVKADQKIIDDAAAKVIADAKAIEDKKLADAKAMEVEAQKTAGKMTKAKFDKIQNGMNYEEVTKIIGGPGEVLSESGDKGTEYYTVMYQYDGIGSLGANSNLMFQGGKLMNKAQFGLK